MIRATLSIQDAVTLVVYSNLNPHAHNNAALLVGKGKAGQQVRGGPSRHRRSSPRRPAGATLLLLHGSLYTANDQGEVFACDHNRMQTGAASAGL